MQLSTMRILLILLIIYFAGCTQKSETEKPGKTAEFDTTAVVKEGKQITKAAFATLSSNLQQALADGGVENALRFCNVEAMPLTDSLSTNYDVTISRVSHRPRNPANRADSLEVATIQTYLQNIKQQTELKPEVYAEAKRIIYHAPIRINNPLCLNCHGKVGTDITETDLQTIHKLYPEDQATGFSMGDLRGLWTVTFPADYFD